MSKDDLSKLAEKFEKKIAQQTKGKIAPPFKPIIAPNDKLVKNPMANENAMDALTEAHYVSLAISSLFRELGIDMDQLSSRSAITQENANRFMQRIKAMLPNLRAVLDRLNTTVSAVPVSTPVEDNPYEST